MSPLWELGGCDRPSGTAVPRRIRPQASRRQQACVRTRLLSCSGTAEAAGARARGAAYSARTYTAYLVLWLLLFGCEAGERVWALVAWRDVHSFIRRLGGHTTICACPFSGVPAIARTTHAELHSCFHSLCTERLRNERLPVECCTVRRAWTMLSASLSKGRALLSPNV